MIAGYIFGAVVIVFVLVYTIAGLHWLFTDLIPNTYRVLRFDRKGICYKCRQPFAEWVATPTDQTYGPDRITQGVCRCGTVSLPRGNRRFADWAGF